MYNLSGANVSENCDETDEEDEDEDEDDDDDGDDDEEASLCSVEYAFPVNFPSWSVLIGFNNSTARSTPLDAIGLSLHGVGTNAGRR